MWDLSPAFSMWYSKTDWLNIYSWPMNNMGWNCTGPLTHTFFSINILLAPSTSRSPILRFNESRGRKEYFQYPVGNLRMGRTDWIDCSTPFYSWDLSIYGLGYPQRSPGTSLCGDQGTTIVKFWRTPKLYAIFDCLRVRALNPGNSQTSTVN